MVAVSPDEISAARDMEAATRQAIAALLESINGASSIPQESRAAMWAEAPALLTLVVVPVVYHLLDQVVPLARAVPGLARLTPRPASCHGLGKSVPPRKPHGAAYSRYR